MFRDIYLLPARNPAAFKEGLGNFFNRQSSLRKIATHSFWPCAEFEGMPLHTDSSRAVQVILTVVYVFYT